MAFSGWPLESPLSASRASWVDSGHWHRSASITMLAMARPGALSLSLSLSGLAADSGIMSPWAVSAPHAVTVKWPAPGADGAKLRARATTVVVARATTEVVACGSNRWTLAEDNEKSRWLATEVVDRGGRCRNSHGRAPTGRAQPPLLRKTGLMQRRDRKETCPADGDGTKERANSKLHDRCKPLEARATIPFEACGDRHC